MTKDTSHLVGISSDEVLVRAYFLSFPVLLCCLFPHGLTLIPSLILQPLLIRYNVDVIATTSGLRLVDLRRGDMTTTGMLITKPVSLVTKTDCM